MQTTIVPDKKSKTKNGKEECRIMISRFSNLLFFTQKISKRKKDYNIQKYIISEHAETFFYGKNEVEVLKRLKDLVDNKNIKQFNMVVAYARPVFDVYWEKASRQLLLWKKYFQKNESLFSHAIHNIEKITGAKKFDISKIPIYLISVTDSKDKYIHAWFSWTPQENFVVVEIPLGLNVPRNFFPISVLAHEFFHLMLRKNKALFATFDFIAEKNKNLLARLSDGMPHRLFLEELLISSFIPEGYLSEKIFHTKIHIHTINPKDLVGWRRYVAFSIYTEAKKYSDNEKMVDENYLNNLIQVIKK